MSLDFCIVDTFSETPLKGGASAVFFVNDEVFTNEELMQNIAMELYVSETIFVKKLDLNNFEILCYNPVSKGMLFGNSLFAASHVLSTMQQRNNDEPIIFKLEDKIFEVNGNKIRFPYTKLEKATLSDSISNSIAGEIIVSVAKSFDDHYVIVEVRSPKKLANLDPNIDILRRSNYDVIIITSDNHYEHNSECDYHTRVFAPRLEVIEDNITPIAHLNLASYWSERLEKTSLIGSQESKKNCLIHSEITPNKDFIYISGEHIVVTNGTLFV